MTKQVSNSDELKLADFWYRRYPELRFFKSRDELKEVKRAFRKVAFKSRRARLSILTLIAASAVLFIFVFNWLDSFGLAQRLVFLINTLFWTVVGGCAGHFIWHRPYIRFVRRYLQDHGVAVCLKCGYDLRGQTEPRCPECGEPFDESLINPIRPADDDSGTHRPPA
jgi:hypothetical protein